MKTISAVAASILWAASSASGQTTRPVAPPVLPPAAPPAVPAGHAGPKVEVFPFTAVQAGGSGGWYGRGIAESLQTDVAKTAAVLTTAATPPADGADPVATAKAGGADLAVVGSFQVNGDQIRIDGRLVDVTTGGTVGTVSTTGAVRDLFKLEDGLGEQVQRLLPAAAPTAAANAMPTAVPPPSPPPVQAVAGQTVVPPPQSGGTTVIIVQQPPATPVRGGNGGSDLPPIQNTYINNNGGGGSGAGGYGGGYGGYGGYDGFGFFPLGFGYGGFGYGGSGFGGFGNGRTGFGGGLGYGGGSIYGYYPGSFTSGGGIGARNNFAVGSGSRGGGGRR